MDKKKNYVLRSVVCYFCNEQFPENQLQEHVKQCGLVLEPCSEGCAAWLQRRHLELHAAECPRKTKTQAQNQQSAQKNADDQIELTEIAPAITLLQQSVSSLRSAFNEELRQRLKMITDLGQLQKRFQESEAWSTHVQGVLDTLRRSLDRIVQDNNSARIHNRTDVEKIAIKCQMFDEWKMEVDMRLDGLRNMVLDEENNRSQMEAVLNRQETKFRRLNEFEEDMDLIRQSALKQQEESSNIRREVASAIYEEQKLRQEQLQGLESKQASLLFELKTLRGTLEDNSDLLAQVKKQLGKQEKLVAQLTQQVKDAEAAKAYHRTMDLPVNGTGHLIWRIDDYKAKMENAKANRTSLHSPTFCSNKYGYNLRMELHLNGNGKWRGRHVTCGLQVLPGPWDPLLIWPCMLPVDVTLRNQSKDPEMKNITKTLMVKRLEASSSSDSAGQLVFFPHELVKQDGYVENDVMFLEVKVRKQRREAMI